MIKKSIIEKTTPIVERIYEMWKVFHNDKEDLENPESWDTICNDDFGINMTTFNNIVDNLKARELIKIKAKSSSPFENDDSIKDFVVIDYVVSDLSGLEKYLSELKSIYPKRKEPLIKKKILELIAREMGEMASGTTLISFLEDCGVDKKLIIYPNTKWKMIYNVLEYLAYSNKNEDKNILFKIIEGACHPLMYGGDKNLAKKTADKFNSFLEYDDFFIKDGVLWEGWNDGVGLSWSDKDGNNFEDKLSYLIIPQQMDKLYVYWNELIKLAKFYFNNKDSQDDEINDIYFEIIANVEKLLNSNGCGGLKEIYKKPFGNIIGCEFEIQKQGLTTDGLFVNLYDFLGKITELSLPDKDNIEKIKKDNSVFLAKIKQYSEQHLAKKEIIQKPPATKIEITKIPELKIKKSEKLSENEEIIKLSPEVYGMGINLKALFGKIWKKISRKK